MHLELRKLGRNIELWKLGPNIELWKLACNIELWKLGRSIELVINSNRISTSGSRELVMFSIYNCNTWSQRVHCPEVKASFALCVFVSVCVTIGSGLRLATANVCACVCVCVSGACKITVYFIQTQRLGKNVNADVTRERCFETLTLTPIANKT